MPRIKKQEAKLKALKLNKALRRHKGSQASLARELGVTRAAINQQIKKNPELTSLRQLAINKAMERAGITTELIYGQLAQALKAKAQASYLGQVYESQFNDHATQLKAIPIGLELFQHINYDQKEESKPSEIHIHYGHRAKKESDST